MDRFTSDPFTFDIVASPLHDESELSGLIGPVADALERIGGIPGTGTSSVPHAIVVATGGTEAPILDRLNARAQHEPGCPALLIAHRHHNSLPAALEALARIHQLGRRGRIVFLGADVADGAGRVAEIDEAVCDLAAWHRFHDTRLGLVGTPSDWLVASTPSAELVRRTWGPTLLDVSIPETIVAFDAVPVEIGRAVAERFGTSPAESLPMPHDATRAARLEPALRTMIERDGLDAITVRCFDFLGTIETSGCLALAQLNDDGVVAGCEGDVPAALALLWARHLLDQPGWIANPASVDRMSNELVLAHCTIAPSMIDAVELSTHFESGIGVGVHGRLRHDDVTLIRIGGADLDRCWIAEGSVVATGHEADLCRTQATVSLADRDVTELLDDPLGNHLVLVEGRHRARLERWWTWAVG